MYTLIRCLLIVTYLSLLYCFVLVAILGSPATGRLLGVAVVLRSFQEGRQYLTTLGSAR